MPLNQDTSFILNSFPIQSWRDSSCTQCKIAYATEGGYLRETVLLNTTP